jgi:hypothetical protein
VNATATIYDSRTSGTRITDLQNISGAAVTSVTTDSFGQAVFFGPDNYIATLWLDFGSGVRWALSPKAVDLAATRAIAVQRAADANAATLSYTPKAHLPYSPNDPLEQALATALDGGVINRVASQSARDAAFPSPINGDRVYRLDLAAEQVYNGSLGVWRTSNYVFDYGSVGVTNTVSNTATETVISSATLPGNYATPGATFRATAFGVAIPAASTTPTLTFRLKVGGVTGTSAAAAVFTAASNASPTNRPWQLTGYFTVLTVGAGANWFGSLQALSSLTSTTTLNAADASLRNDGTSVFVKDSTVSQTLAVTAQWGTASASNICTLYGWSWERIS